MDAYTLSRYQPLVIEFDSFIKSGKDWLDIPWQKKVEMAGIAMEAVHIDEITDLLINSELLNNAVLSTLCYMKKGSGKDEVARDMRDIIIGFAMKCVEEAFGIVASEMEDEINTRHGLYPFKSRETGETEWRHAR